MEKTRRSRTAWGLAMALAAALLVGSGIMLRYGVQVGQTRVHWHPLRGWWGMQKVVLMAWPVRGAVIAALPLLLALLLAGAGSATTPGVAPAVVRDPVRKIPRRGWVLCPTLVRLIRQQFPGFHLPKSEEPACAGDFDGNGLPDAAVYLTDRRSGVPKRRSRWLFVAFHQIAPGSFRAFVIERRPDPSVDQHPDEDRPCDFDDYSIERKSRGSRLRYNVGRYGEATMRLQHDGIAEYFSESEQVYHFRRGRYRHVEIAELEDLEQH